MMQVIVSTREGPSWAFSPITCAETPSKRSISCSRETAPLTLSTRQAASDE